MSTFCLASMDTSVGWEIQSVETALAKHFTYWLTSRRNQGKVMGGVPSFFYLFMKYSQTPEALVEKAQQELDSYMGEMWPQREVIVTFEYIGESRSLYSVQLNIKVISDGKLYDLGRTIEKTGEDYRILDEKRLAR